VLLLEYKAIRADMPSDLIEYEIGVSDLASRIAIVPVVKKRATSCAISASP
jgi:hypothetical protein